MSQVVQALAFVARREALRSMPVSRWAHVLSLELGWMTPGQARRFVQVAVDAGVLVLEGDDARLSVEPSAVEVPRGFRPDPDAEPVPDAHDAPDAGPDGDPFPAWLRRVGAATARDAGAVMEAVEAVQARFGGRLGAFPALLVVAREAGLDVVEAAGAALDDLTS